MVSCPCSPEPDASSASAVAVGSIMEVGSIVAVGSTVGVGAGVAVGACLAVGAAVAVGASVGVLAGAPGALTVTPHALNIMTIRNAADERRVLTGVFIDSPCVIDMLAASAHWRDRATPPHWYSAGDAAMFRHV
jgi:hypothetical protein